MSKNKKVIIGKLIMFSACTILAAWVIFMILSVYHSNTFFPRLVSRATQSFAQDVLFRELHDFELLENGAIRSVSDDPWIVVRTTPAIGGSYLSIRVSGLSVNETSAQIFFVLEGESFTELNSVRFTLRNGLNTITLPNSGYAALRLDLAEVPNISMIIDEVVLSNYIAFSWQLWVVFFVLLLLCTTAIYSFFFKPAVISRIHKKIQGYVERNIISHAEGASDGSQLEQSGFLGLFKQSRFYWVCVIITAILCYGFTLTNFSLGVDDEALRQYNFGGISLGQGRWGGVPLRYILDSYYFLPFWRDFIALFLIIIGFTLFCGLFRKYSNGRFDDKAATIFTCIAISFSWIAHIFIFMGGTIEIGLIIIFTGISSFFACKWMMNKMHFLYAVASAITLGYATAFYEIAMIYFFTVGFSLLLLHFLFSADSENNHFRQFIALLAKFVGIAIVALLVWRLGALLLQSLYNIGPSGYITHFVGYDTNSVSAFLNSFLVFLREFFHQKIVGVGFGLSGEQLIWGASLIIITIALILSLILKKINILLSGIFLVVSAYGLLFITGNTHLFLRTQFTFSVLIAFCFSFLYVIFRNVKYKKFKANYLLVFITILIVFNQSREMNQIFYLDYQRYQHDLAMMHTINQDLDSFDRNKPIIFVGTAPNPLPAREVAGASIFGWDRWFGVDYRPNVRIHNFFSAHGFSITHPHGVAIDRHKIYGMASWPKEGYIREFEDFIVVRLGPSVLDVP